MKHILASESACPQLSMWPLVKVEENIPVMESILACLQHMWCRRHVKRPDSCTDFPGLLLQMSTTFPRFCRTIARTFTQTAWAWLPTTPGQHLHLPTSRPIRIQCPTKTGSPRSVRTSSCRCGAPACIACMKSQSSRPHEHLAHFWMHMHQVMCSTMPAHYILSAPCLGMASEQRLCHSYSGSSAVPREERFFGFYRAP